MIKEHKNVLTHLKELEDFYKHQLLDDTIPFWFPRSYDREFGGFLLMRDADGRLIDTDKAVWIQGRATWLLATLCNSIEYRAEWHEGARLGYEFLKSKCFDTDGRMYFHVTREGHPIRKRRYFFSETFAVIAFAAYAKLTGDQAIRQEAIDLFERCRKYASGEISLPGKFNDTRPMKGIGVPMIMLNTAQQLRENLGIQDYDDYMLQLIQEIETNFVKDDIQCVMEQVALDGSIVDSIDGRTLNPGHAIEGAWFILHEAKYRNNDPRLVELGCRMLDYMWERGWDPIYGGIKYFLDVYDNPVQEYWHNMKFWWPQNETIIACLLAYTLTDNDKYLDMHDRIRQYAYASFHDKEHGEWFGYLNYDNTVSQTAKGNLFKGPFHLPRQEWYCYLLLKKYLNRK
ncbi:N-acylglucosamine 2-epimerase [Sphingobacterium sp. SGG-5]|nr:N-acylglucosamine 2-epimerase [Sphingobacterium sp. SGG-5]